MTTCFSPILYTAFVQTVSIFSNVSHMIMSYSLSLHIWHHFHYSLFTQFLLLLIPNISCISTSLPIFLSLSTSISHLILFCNPLFYESFPWTVQSLLHCFGQFLVQTSGNQLKKEAKMPCNCHFICQRRGKCHSKGITLQCNSEDNAYGARHGLIQNQCATTTKEVV